MDSELREYLDRHFEENRQHLERHVDARFEENRQHLERHVGARFEENRQHLERHVGARFEENRQHLERHVGARFEENRQHLERHVGARFEENRQHLERHVGARFEENQEQISELRSHMDARFGKVDGQIRQSHVAIEEVRGLVQTVAEGVVAVREAQRKTNQELKEDVGEVRDLLTASYRHLDQRLRVVEGM